MRRMSSLDRQLNLWSVQYPSRMAESDTGHERVVIYWTLYTDTGGSLACELSRTARGLMVRCLDQQRNVLLSDRVAKAGDGAALAAQWKGHLLVKGEYFARPGLVSSSFHEKPSRRFTGT
jgi:hypothetical protein